MTPDQARQAAKEAAQMLTLHLLASTEAGASDWTTAQLEEIIARHFLPLASEGRLSASQKL